MSDWSDDETQLLLTEYVSANESSVHLLDLATGTVKPLTPQGGEGGAPEAQSSRAMDAASSWRAIAARSFAQLVQIDHRQR